MRIFQGIPTSAGAKSILEASRALAEACARSRPASGLLSLCELAADGEDFRWLEQWGRHLSHAVAHSWLHSQQNANQRTLLGLLLLFLFAEQGRRTAQEGQIWPAVSNLFHPRTHDVLFTKEQPAEELKVALKEAVRRVKLRHAFDIPETQSWIDTIYLQFGFTHAGLQSRLPEWLEGHGRPWAVAHLLEGAQHSESFQQLWQSLVAFRRDRLTAEQLKARLVTSPWLLHDWLEDIIAAAARPARARATPSGDTRRLAMGHPRLELNPKPVFLCPLAERPASLEDPTHDIFLDDRPSPVGRLLRQVDGTYKVNGSERGELTLTGISAPEAELRIAGKNGPSLLTDKVQFWNWHEEVTVFDLRTGRRLRPESSDRLHAGVEYALITASDVRVEPPPLEFQPLPGGEWTVHRLCLEADQQVRCFLADELVWTAQGGERWSHAVETLIAPVGKSRLEPGGSALLRVHHPSEVSISTCIVDDEVLPLASRGAEMDTFGPFRLHLTSPGDPITVLLKARQGDDKRTLRRRLKPALQGAAIRHATGWRPLGEKTPLRLTEASLHPIRILLPQDPNKTVTSFIFEGERCVGQARNHNRPLNTLHGLGARLSVWSSRFNDRNELWVLASKVVDTGVISSASFNASGALITVQLDSPIQPDADAHRLVVWSEGGALALIPPTDIHVDPDSGAWRVSRRLWRGSPWAVAIAYHGVRVGGFWSEGWYDSLSHSALRNSARTAALARWFRLPILEPTAQPLQRGEAIWGDIPTAITTWLTGSALPHELAQRESDEPWLVSVSTHLRNWRPTEQQREDLVTQLTSALEQQTGGQGELHPLPIVAKLLVSLDPFLMSSCIEQRLNAVAATRPEAARELLQRTRHAVVGTSEAHLRAEYANQLGWEGENLLESILASAEMHDRRDLNGFQQRNLATASHVEAFRQLLGLRLLKRAEDKLLKRR